MRRVFVDTSIWFAAAFAEDPDHERVRSTLTGGDRLVTSNFVMDETITICAGKLGHRVAARVGELLLDTDEVDLVRLTAADELEAWKLFLERPDKRYSFTDCTSIVLMRRLGIEVALALDDDFRQAGFEV
ncbi:MAG: PIN domain-containing protein, partial [Deltaproteobacteria bacterium]|nr:PIN domain-containing protein [Deltaproteobacteria bacterium]